MKPLMKISGFFVCGAVLFRGIAKWVSVSFASQEMHGHSERVPLVLTSFIFERRQRARRRDYEKAAQRYSFGTKRVPRKVPLFRMQRTHAPRRAPRQARPFFPGMFVAPS